MTCCSDKWSGRIGEEMNTQGLKGLFVCALAAVMGSAAAQTLSLTGVNWYTTDASKHFTGGYANTYGGDTYSRNLYLTENNTVGAGSLLNSVNLTTLPTRVQVNLTSPGTYTFQVYCNDESTAVNPYWGLNLFFNNDDLHPGISVWNTVNVAGFQMINAIGTATLDPLTMGTVTSSSGSGQNPGISSGATQVTLTSYSTWSANHYNVDRVDNFADDGGAGNGTKDNVIEFTLQTTTVPEPCSIILLGGSSLGVLLRRRATRKS